jgi:HD-GYP domain-containing protein (c-di-GMP phosphodiesterase class II)
VPDDATGSGPDSAAGPPARLAELVAALSLGIDLGFGQPMEHVLRQCVIALRMAERIGLDDQARSAVYYTALLVNVGCHTDAHEQAKWFGDDIALKSHKYDYGPRTVAGAAASMRMLGRGRPPLHRFRVGLEFAVSGRRDLDGMIARHAETAASLARELGLPGAVQDAVGSSYEQWDGRGWPGRLRGDQVPVAARLAQLAEYAEVAHRVGGVAAAADLARRRGGRQFDPALAGLLRSCPEEILGGLESEPTWETVIAAEPALAVTLPPGQLDAALLGIASFVDLKSPYTLGHARGVAALAAAAGRQLGLSADDIATLRRSALVQDLGRLGVSNAIWDKRGPLGAGERERVHLHPYLTERMLRQSACLARYGAIAVQHHERLDGSGYPRGLAGGAISRPARILGAADTYQALCEPRPHREARPPDAAARELRAEVRAGRLEASAAEAVLAAAGHGTVRRAGPDVSLTAREADVLRLVAQGLSSRQIAERLVISPKTARNHIEHIYAKAGVSSRATASLYALRAGLLPEQELPGGD